MDDKPFITCSEVGNFVYCKKKYWHNKQKVKGFHAEHLHQNKEKGQALHRDFSFNAPQKTTGGCFIATAVYGPLHPNLDVLRAFRNENLLRSRSGRKFVKLYYKYSPGVAERLEKRDFAKFAIRLLLNIFVKAISIWKP